MDTYMTGRIEMSHGAKLVNVQVYINNQRMEVDEIGGFSINVSEILAPSNAVPGVVRLQMELEQELTREQITDFWYILGTSKGIITQDVALSLNIDKREAKDILLKGIACKVLTRGFNSTWKVVDKITKDRIIKVHKEMQDEHTSKGKSVDEMLQGLIKGEGKTAKEIAEAEETVTREQKEVETMETLYNEDEPAKIFVGMKGGTKIQSREVMKKEITQKATKNVGVIVPKKKPLVSKPISKKKVL